MLGQHRGNIEQSICHLSHFAPGQPLSTDRLPLIKRIAQPPGSGCRYGRRVKHLRTCKSRYLSQRIERELHWTYHLPHYLETADLPG